MEQTHVHEVYSKIAKHFNETRYKPWPLVEQFLYSLQSSVSILDVGCGNGKYLSIRPDCSVHGCDPCAALLSFAQEKNPHAELLLANGLSLPYKSQSMDYGISIAVFHHLSTMAMRRQFLSELRRVVTNSVLLTVWSHDAVRSTWLPGNTSGDYMVPWHNHDDGLIYQRYYHVFTKDELTSLCREFFSSVDVQYEKENWYVYLAT